MKLDKVCTVCARSYAGDDPGLCGENCRTIEDMFRRGVGSSLVAAPDGDPRTFFYDASVGSLMCQWMKLALRRTVARDRDNQQELDFQLHRIRKAIGTKVSVRAPSKDEQEVLIKMARSLLGNYVKGWRLNMMARNRRMPEDSRTAAAIELLEIADRKATFVRQIDLILSGRTVANRCY